MKPIFLHMWVKAFSLLYSLVPSYSLKPQTANYLLIYQAEEHK